MRTWPRLPPLFPSTNSSVFESWMFMYESTLINRPLYSVCPHFSRTMISSLTLVECVSLDILCKCVSGDLSYRPCSMGRGLRGMNYNSVSRCSVATKKMRNLHLHSSWINSVFDQVKFQQVLLRRIFRRRSMMQVPSVRNRSAVCWTDLTLIPMTANFRHSPCPRDCYF